MGILNKIFKSYSEKEVNRVIPIVDKIEKFDDQMKALSDDELKAKTQEFRDRLEKDETLEELLPEAFAVVREAAFRVLGMKHFREQLIGGVVLSQGRIAEMKTGEGKTLVATLPSYLNGLTGKGVHIVTVNDYLATRDKEWMGQVYEFLGLSVGVIVHNLTQQQRQDAYACDITYGTNNEFGFDYLRDNMVVYKEERVQRPLNYSIVDEVDSILIDEARTPLIISGEGDKSTEFYKVADTFAKMLKKDDYTVDEKSNSVILNDTGVEMAEKYFHLENYADPSNMEIQHHVAQALKGNFMMKKDKDYMVKDNEVLIVDEFTGRLMEGRRYSDGLHQAIEAKEGVKVQKESKTLATITFQNYFRLYNKLSGMTGTALTEEVEFREIYDLDVIVVPTHKEVGRKDSPDLVYKTEMGKFNAVVEEIEETHKIGGPVLVGTVSIEKSEVISNLLKKKGIKHQVLNAKYHEKEAEIITHAGEKGMITIATNMAGRGTDIKLEDGVVELGGLKIIGTERHESRRIDNQLRGRAGRQGDPGSSRFYVSLQDDLMRIFGSEKLGGMVERLGLQDDEAIESRMVSGAIENAQKKVEGNNFDIRKTLIKYDDVMNQQREIIYKQRSEVLEGENMELEIKKMIKDIITSAIDSHLSGIEEDLEQDLGKMLDFLNDICIPDKSITVEELKILSDEEIKEKLLAIATDVYSKKEKEFGEDQIREIERVILLRIVDTKWMDHIDNMDHLKQGMNLRAYRQQDPVQAYQFEGSQMFAEMIYNIRIETIKYLFHVQISRAPAREQVAKVTATNHDESVENKPIRRKEEKIGRNDPCPCGSGKKYKNCHGIIA